MYSILLTEDDQVTAMMAEDILSARGCSVHWAATAAETRDRLAKEAYDALIMDLGLPDETGSICCGASPTSIPGCPSSS